MSKFNEQLGDVGLAKTSLPLVHTTSFETSLQILQAGTFDCPTPCPIYGENLLYTFIARPVYRFPQQNDPKFGVAFAPVCFLLRPECASGSARALPFDSGGFDRYEDQMHGSWSRADFELHPPDDRLGQVIHYFWPDEDSYYGGDPRAALAIPAVHTLLQQYYTLITNGITHGFDARCSTLEVQLPAPLALEGNIMAVCAPHRAADDAEFSQMVEAINADLFAYKYHEPFYNNDFFTSVFDAVELYLKGKALI